MGLFKGGFMRLFQTFLYSLLFCCAAIILGLYSYFLAVNHTHNYNSTNYVRAVEGISGAAVLYLIFAVLLTCCLGGIAFLAFIAIVIDVAFCGAMIAVAVMARDGAHSCSGLVQTPVGTGPSDFGAGYDNNLYSGIRVYYRPQLYTACRMNTAVFAVAIISAFLFLITAAVQFALIRTHKKEKRFGPGPSNGYTSGYGKKRGLFGRKSKAAKAEDAELAAGTGLAAGQPDLRPSHETGFTGSTVAGTAVHDKDVLPPVTGNHAGYHTAPTGTAVNPYGYDNNLPAATHANVPTTGQAYTTGGPTYTTGTATNY